MACRLGVVLQQQNIRAPTKAVELCVDNAMTVTKLCKFSVAGPHYNFAIICGLNWVCAVCRAPMYAQTVQVSGAPCLTIISREFVGYLGLTENYQTPTGDLPTW